MQTDVQWFVSALIDNELVTLEDATALDNELGGDSDLGTFAQTFLERYVAATGMSEEDSAQLVESIQQLIDYAVTQAETGEMPGFALEAEPKRISSGKLPGPKRRPKPAAPAGPPAEAPQSAAPAQEAPAEGSAAPEIKVASEGFEFFDHLQEMNDKQLAETMKNLLFQLVDYGASDLHISANSTPFVRRNLKIERLSNTIITAEYAEKLNTVLLSPEQKARFKEDMDMNFALELNGSRYRVALMYQKDGISGSYRIVPSKAKTLEELGFLPKDAETITKLMDYPNGLVLVTGPIGSGKTTTLAALINICNNNREDHIISVEDPIEIVQPPINCQITQRQLHDNTESYSNALRGALRQDPDIIVIGEMFDLETIENAITASETGHLVQTVVDIV